MAIKRLLAFDVTQLDYKCEGGTPIHAAITGIDPINTLRYLVSFKPEIIDAKDLTDVSPLFLATFTGNTNLVGLMIEKNVDCMSSVS